MKMRLDGKVAIITGAGRGLGREQALLLARRGAKVVVNDLGVAIDGSAPSAVPAQAVVDVIKENGGQAIANASDMSSAEGVKRVVADAVEAFGGVDILVCNAGTVAHGVDPEGLTPDMFQAQLDLMVSGVGLLVSAAWPHLASSGHGRIVLTSSSAGAFGIKASAYYGAAKGGVLGLLRCLALDGAGCGIKVNAICPLASTRLFAGFSDNQEFNDWFDDRAKPEYAAPVVGYLSHSECEPTGRAFLVGLGHVGEIFTGLTKGWSSSGHDMEDVRDHFDKITDRIGYDVPTSSMGATGFIIKDAPVRNV